MTNAQPRFDIKIFGERNTGTNALEQFIESNSMSRVVPNPENTYARVRDVYRAVRYVTRNRALFERLCCTFFPESRPLSIWKHAATGFSDAASFDGVQIIFTVRHPASWLLALHRAPYHIVESIPSEFSEFLRMPVSTFARDRLGGRKLTPVQLLNEKVESYAAFARQLEARGNPGLYIKFEDIVTAQPKVFEQLRQHLRNPVATPRVLEQSTKDKTEDLSYYKDYYGNELWREKLDARASEYINTHVRWELFAPLGYAPEQAQPRSPIAQA